MTVNEVMGVLAGLGIGGGLILTAGLYLHHRVKTESIRDIKKLWGQVSTLPYASRQLMLEAMMATYGPRRVQEALPDEVPFNRVGWK